MFEPIARKTTLGGLGFVELYDFSAANVDMERRMMAVTKVAAVSRGKEASSSPARLYHHLLTESNGGPSSAFEFVPVIARLDEYMRNAGGWCPNGARYGIKVEEYLITNLRATLSDGIDVFTPEGLTPLIRANVITCRMKVDVVTAR